MSLVYEADTPTAARAAVAAVELSVAEGAARGAGAAAGVASVQAKARATSGRVVFAGGTFSPPGGASAGRALGAGHGLALSTGDPASQSWTSISRAAETGCVDTFWSRAAEEVHLTGTQGQGVPATAGPRPRPGPRPAVEALARRAVLEMPWEVSVHFQAWRRIVCTERGERNAAGAMRAEVESAALRGELEGLRTRHEDELSRERASLEALRSQHEEELACEQRGRERGEAEATQLAAKLRELTHERDALIQTAVSAKSKGYQAEYPSSPGRQLTSARKDREKDDAERELKQRALEKAAQLELALEEALAGLTGCKDALAQEMKLRHAEAKTNAALRSQVASMRGIIESVDVALERVSRPDGTVDASRLVIELVRLAVPHLNREGDPQAAVAVVAIAQLEAAVNDSRRRPSSVDVASPPSAAGAKQEAASAAAAQEAAVRAASPARASLRQSERRQSGSSVLVSPLQTGPRLSVGPTLSSSQVVAHSASSPGMRRGLIEAQSAPSLASPNLGLRAPSPGSSLAAPPAVPFRRPPAVAHEGWLAPDQVASQASQRRLATPSQGAQAWPHGAACAAGTEASRARTPSPSPIIASHMGGRASSPIAHRPQRASSPFAARGVSPLAVRATSPMPGQASSMAACPGAPAGPLLPSWGFARPGSQWAAPSLIFAAPLGGALCGAYAPLGAVPLGSAPLGSAPFGGVPLGSAPLGMMGAA